MIEGKQGTREKQQGCRVKRVMCSRVRGAYCLHHRGKKSVGDKDAGRGEQGDTGRGQGDRMGGEEGVTQGREGRSGSQSGREGRRERGAGRQAAGALPVTRVVCVR